MTIEGKVVKVLGPMEVVVNLGREDGLENHHTLLVYTLGEELTDPDTNESLGQLEIVRGRGEPKHIQERIATIASLERKRVLRDRKRPYPRNIVALLGPYTEQYDVVQEEVEVSAPFERVEVGDLVRVLT